LLFPVPVLAERFAELPMLFPVVLPLPIVLPLPMLLPVVDVFAPVDMPLLFIVLPVDIPLASVVEPEVVLVIIELLVFVLVLRLFATELPVFEDSPQAANANADVKTRPRPNTLRITILLKRFYSREICGLLPNLGATPLFRGETLRPLPEPHLNELPKRDRIIATATKAYGHEHDRNVYPHT
jgi:hypothetical protein